MRGATLFRANYKTGSIPSRVCLSAGSCVSNVLQAGCLGRAGKGIRLDGRLDTVEGSIEKKKKTELQKALHALECANLTLALPPGPPRP